MTSGHSPIDGVLTELERLGEIVSAILDGEEVKHIITDEAMHYVAHPHPDHPFLAGDHYDVDHVLFLRTKKLLLRIARMSDLDVGTTVLVGVPDTDLVTVALHNGTCFRYCRALGQLCMPSPRDVTDVFETGRSASVPACDADPMATVLTPVRDSLGDVVAVVELSARVDGQSAAWS